MTKVEREQGDIQLLRCGYAARKAHGDRDRALHNVARLLGTKAEALSPHIVAVVDAMLGEKVFG